MGAAIYAAFLEIRRGRSLWKLVRWLESERPDEWSTVHSPRANIEDSMSRLRERRLSQDAEYTQRHDAATSRGRQMAVTVAIAGTAVLALLAVITLVD